MNKPKVTPVASRIGTPMAPSPKRKFATINLVLALSGLSGVSAQAQTTPYATMAPIEQYLSVDRSGEIAQARSAAPPAISDGAEVLVLGAHGYQTAVKGKNGFVCLVQRAWFSDLDDVGFWNPKMRAPICFNRQGARSVLSTFLARSVWAMDGLSKAEMINRTKAAIAAHTFAAPEIGTLTYMMAKDAYLGDRPHGHWHPHIMFYLPRMSTADWGADLAHSPVMSSESAIEPYTIFYVPVAKWSDGTPDEAPPHL